MTRLRLVALGGTIAMGAAGPSGVSHSLDGADLAGEVAAALAAAGCTAEVEAVTLRRAPGSQLTIGDVLEVADEIARGVDDGVDGVVVTQGTDTIEETSFLLELLGAARRVPVVVSGAMRNPTLPGADGPANLLAAASTALSPAAAGLGVLVVLGDEIHASRFVAKRHTTSPAAFVSHPGPLGWLSEGRPVIVARPAGDLAVDGAAEGLRSPAPPEVALLRSFVGDDGRVAGRIDQLGYAGLVVEGTGGGHVTAHVAELLGDLSAKMPVVIASRTGAGAVLRSTYAFDGGEIDLARRGVIGAGWLPGIKARLLLLALLATEATREQIVESFARFA